MRSKMIQNIDSTYLPLIKLFFDQKILKRERNLFLIQFLARRLSILDKNGSKTGRNQIKMDQPHFQKACFKKLHSYKLCMEISFWSTYERWSFSIRIWLVKTKLWSTFDFHLQPHTVWTTPSAWTMRHGNHFL